jgi:hypothetical protein
VRVTIIYSHGGLLKSSSGLGYEKKKIHLNLLGYEKKKIHLNLRTCSDESSPEYHDTVLDPRLNRKF